MDKEKLFKNYEFNALNPCKIISSIFVLIIIIVFSVNDLKAQDKEIITQLLLQNNTHHTVNVSSIDTWLNNSPRGYIYEFDTIGRIYKYSFYRILLDGASYDTFFNKIYEFKYITEKYNQKEIEVEVTFQYKYNSANLLERGRDRYNLTFISDNNFHRIQFFPNNKDSILKFTSFYHKEDSILKIESSNKILKTDTAFYSKDYFFSTLYIRLDFKDGFISFPFRVKSLDVMSQNLYNSKLDKLNENFDMYYFSIPLKNDKSQDSLEYDIYLLEKNSNGDTCQVYQIKYIYYNQLLLIIRVGRLITWHPIHGAMDKENVKVQVDKFSNSFEHQRNDFFRQINQKIHLNYY